ncbi:MAG: hypothetical protein ACREGR_01060 [Minisyncoccia bacterium]
MEREELAALLARHDIPYQAWGKGMSSNSKTFDHLWREVERGESVVSIDSELLAEIGIIALSRKIYPILVHVYIDAFDRDVGRSVRKVLVELKRLKDGSWRPRAGHEANLSEKMRPGKTREEEFLRLLHEELDLRNNRTGKLITMPEVLKEPGALRFFLTPDGKPKSQIYGSRSYPMLLTRNTMERGSWVMPSAYYRPEYKERDEKGNVTGVFRWQGVKEGSVPVPVLYG